MEYTLIIFLVALVFWGGMHHHPFLLRFVTSSAVQELACSI
jgi:hypothetical protein